MSSFEPTSHPDVVVVGGGPAGAAAAGWLASRGRRVLLVEREQFPRFHIGESLLPQCHRAFEALGLVERLENEGLPRKRGAFILSPAGESSGYADFATARGLRRNDTFEVARDRFDQILLERAAELGAEVSMPCRATDVRFTADGVEVDLRDAAGDRTVHARALIDASGRDGFLAKRLDLREVDPELKQVGLHAWFEDVVPPPEGHAGDIRLISLYEGGWSWLIPLPGGRTSVGVVVPVEVYRRYRGAEAAFDALLASAPALAERVAPGRRVTEVRVDADYSYRARRHAGDRWLLAGDAGSFLDPIFSTGVLLALDSGLDAAEAVDRGLASGSFQRPFARYQREQRRIYEIFRRFVLAFYGPGLRDLLVYPGNPLGLRTAVTTILAGVSRPDWSTRFRLQIFYLVLRWQERRGLVPRVHLAPPEPAASAEVA